MKLPGWLEPREHQVDHGDLGHRLASFRQVLVFDPQPAVSDQPGERSLDHPPPGLVAFPRKPAGREPSTEGTWGWDYVGLGRRPGRVFLDWWHGNPHQPAAGPYKTDAARYFDPLTVKPVKKLAEVGKPAEGHE